MPTDLLGTIWQKNSNTFLSGEVVMDLPDKNNDIYFKGLIAMMEHLSEPWGIKDLHSRHVYMNQAAYLYTNIPLNSISKVKGTMNSPPIGLSSLLNL